MPVAGFRETSFTHDGVTRAVYRRGVGPAVIVMHEVPGIVPEVSAFATRVAEAGFDVFLPSLFGDDGRPFSVGYAVAQIARACVSREFSVLAQRRSSPIADWLRALARAAHREVGGKGVGAIGMCLTGNFALAMAMDDVVMAPVVSQPSLPFPVSASARRSLHLSDGDLSHLKRRAADGLQVMGLRFTGDPSCPKARFDRLSEELGPAFLAVEIDSSRDNPFRPGAHSVLTLDLVDREGHPTRAALDRVLAFFRERLT